MAKKIKYYGVFAVKVFERSEFVKTVTEILDLPKLPRKQIKVFVFDNELEQMKCLSNLPTEPGDILISIDSTSKDEFMKKVYELKEEHSKSVEEEEPDDDCEEEQPTNEQKEPRYTVTLMTTGDPLTDRVHVIKAIKDAFGLGLKEAKMLTEDLPTIIAEHTSKKNAESIKKLIEDAGGTVMLAYLS